MSCRPRFLAGDSKNPPHLMLMLASSSISPPPPPNPTDHRPDSNESGAAQGRLQRRTSQKLNLFFRETKKLLLVSHYEQIKIKAFQIQIYNRSYVLPRLTHRNSFEKKNSKKKNVRNEGRMLTRTRYRRNGRRRRRRWSLLGGWMQIGAGDGGEEISSKKRRRRRRMNFSFFSLFC